MPPTPDTFSAWADRIRDSDRKAFDGLYSALRKPLFRYAWTFLRDEDACYDLLQDVFLKLWMDRQKLNPAKSIRALLYTMVRNRALNRIRDEKHAASRRADDEPDLVGSAASPLEEADARSLNDYLHKIIDELPERRKEVLILSRYEGLSHAEIAQSLNISARTVNNHLVLALQDLRGRLQELDVLKTDV